MVKVIVEDICWCIECLLDKTVRICRDDKILGYIFKEIPSSEHLLDIALEGICQDIRDAVVKERGEKKK